MYRYGLPFRRRDGSWVYWGKHDLSKATPEIVGSFATDDEARQHAETHGYGKLQKKQLRRPWRGAHRGEA